MRILIDIAHPAHVHLFRNFYHEMKMRGHELLITVKELPSAKRLLQIYGMPFINLGSKSDGLAGKARNQLLYDWRMLRLVLKHRIEIGIGSSITLPHVSMFTGMKSIMLDDDDDAVEPLVTRFGHPFADTVVSPDALTGNRKKRGTVFYPGYHELAYLHPARFRPDPTVQREAGVGENESYFVLRFNAFKAHHDKGIRGIDNMQKRELVNLLRQHGRVLITAEKETEPEFKECLINISPEKIHSLVYYSTMFVGDSQTMASEAAVLGVPALRCNSFAGRLSILEEEEKRYGLTYAFAPDRFELLLGKVRELLAQPGLRAEWQQRRQRLLDDKIDVTSFLIWLVEHYPGSTEQIASDPQVLARLVNRSTEKTN